MTLLTNPAENKQIGIHALIIGVGKYPYLRAANSTLQAWVEGLIDLDSPPLSAVAMTKWLRTQMQHDQLKLKSLEVLASSPTNCQKFDGTSVAVEAPTIENIQAAASRWFDAANAHPENLAFFYFCGHGFSVGDVHSLLAQDFGLNVSDLSQQAFDPTRLVSGMLKCAANQQLFIIDACSSQYFDIQSAFGNNQARALIAGTNHERLKVVSRSVINTSQVGTEAFGKKDCPSVFMDAFLLAMQGAGAIQDDDSRWYVTPTMLKIGIDILMKRQLGTMQQCLSFGIGTSADFMLHRLAADPVVPVMITCSPPMALEKSKLHCSSGDHRDPVCEPWHLDLPMDDYIYKAECIQTGTVAQEQPGKNRPPRLVVSIPVR